MATLHHKKRKSSQEKHDELEGVKKKKKSSRDGGRGRYVSVGLNFLFRAHQQIDEMLYALPLTLLTTGVQRAAADPAVARLQRRCTASQSW